MHGVFSRSSYHLVSDIIYGPPSSTYAYVEVGTHFQIFTSTVRAISWHTISETHIIRNIKGIYVPLAQEIDFLIG